MFDLGGGELLLILLGVLILFGPKKLPELAQGLGKGIRQFKKAQQEFTDQINGAFAEEQRKESSRKARPGAENTIHRSAGISLPSTSPAGDAPERDAPGGFAPDHPAIEPALPSAPAGEPETTQATGNDAGNPMPTSEAPTGSAEGSVPRT